MAARRMARSGDARPGPSRLAPAAHTFRRGRWPGLAPASSHAGASATPHLSRAGWLSMSTPPSSVEPAVVSGAPYGGSRKYPSCWRYSDPPRSCDSARERGHTSDPYSCRCAVPSGPAPPGIELPRTAAHPAPHGKERAVPPSSWNSLSVSPRPARSSRARWAPGGPPSPPSAGSPDNAERASSAGCAGNTGNAAPADRPP